MTCTVDRHDPACRHQPYIALGRRLERDARYCGFRASCGRPAGHRGQHGGWRTGVVSAQPPEPGTLVGRELAPMHLRVVVEMLLHGDQAEAAACIGISHQTLKNHTTEVLRRTGAPSMIAVPYLLGWIRPPLGTFHVEARTADGVG